MAETEFYEHVGESGVVRRRSMIKPLNKDDRLLVRGANPRTGLVTPDANSVAGSLEGDRTACPKKKGPSAQWRLEGDNWISTVPQDEVTRYKDDQKQTRMDNSRASTTAQTLLDQAPKAKFNPLTTSNLMAFSNDMNSHDARNMLRAPDLRMPVVKIRRKPVGSPPKLLLASHPPCQSRHSSDQTVIRTPTEERTGVNVEQHFSYNSPDNVRKAVASHESYHLPNFGEQTQSFLGLVVKPRLPATTTHFRGFTSAQAQLNQLQKSLQTSDGPYPSYHSETRMMTQEKNSNHSQTHMAGLQPGQASSGIGSGRDVFPRGAPRICLPDTAIFYDHTELRHRPVESRYITSLDGCTRQPVPRTRKDHITENQQSYVLARSQAMSHNSKVPIMDTIVCTNTSGKRINSDAKYVQECDRVNTSVSFPAQELALENSSRTPHSTLAGLDIDTQRDQKMCDGSSLPKMQNTPIDHEPFVNQILSKTAVEPTTMELRGQLNKIGIREVQRESEERDDERLEEVEDSRNPSKHHRGHSAKDFHNQVHISKSSPSSSLLDRQKPVKDAAKHASCCLDCCVQFDCHEGCLGHPSPASSTAESETSSLTSMRIVDATFKTSVEAINETLLKPERHQKGKFSRLKKAMFQVLAREVDPPTNDTTQNISMRQTLRSSPPRNGERDQCNMALLDSRIKYRGQAKAAATKAMFSDDSMKCISNQVQGKKTRTVRLAPIEWKDIQKYSEATEGNRISSIDKPNSSINTSSSPAILEQDEALSLVSLEGATRNSPYAAQTFSVSEGMNWLIRLEHLQLGRLSLNPRWWNHVPKVLWCMKESLVLLNHTIAVCWDLLQQYKRTSTVTLPENTSISHLIGDCLRSILFVMIATCIYALVVKIARVVFTLLRIVFLPVKLCIWVIG